MSFEGQRPPLGELGYATWIRWQFRVGVLTRGEWETLARPHYALVRRCPSDADRLDELCERRFLRLARQTFEAWSTNEGMQVKARDHDLTPATAAWRQVAGVPPTELRVHRRNEEANVSEEQWPEYSFMRTNQLPDELEAAISEATGVPRHELEISVYDPTRDLQTESELG
jgi:hypothetical protein